MRIIGCLVPLALLLIAATQTAHAEDYDYSQYAGYSDADWEAMRLEVCSRGPIVPTVADSGQSGVWMEPKTRFVNLLSTLAPEIKATAALYDIDPRARWSHFIRRYH